MKKVNNINKSFSETIRKSDLQGVAVNVAEIVLDTMLEEGVLKSLPIVGAILDVGKTVSSVKDQLFLKKIIAFLAGIKDIPQDKRMKMIDSVNESNKYRIKVGEKLIYILDNCDDFIDAKYISQLFCAFLKEEIRYQDFIKGSRIIQNIFIGDLEYFLDNEPSKFAREAHPEEAPDEDEFPLINAGILGFGNNPINIGDRSGRKAEGKYEVRGGEVVIWITAIGEMLKKILNKEKL